MRLPLFLLARVLFPGEQIPLHIFEQDFLAIVAWCLRQKQPFGVLLVDGEQTADVGCTARVSQVIKQYRDGRMDILVTGEQCFEVLELHEDLEDYMVGDLLIRSDELSTPQQGDLQRVIAQHMRLLEIAGRKIRPNLYTEVDHVSYLIARSAGLSRQQKQAVLEMNSEQARIAFLIRHLEQFIPSIEKEVALRLKIQSNGYLESGEWDD